MGAALKGSKDIVVVTGCLFILGREKKTDTRQKVWMSNIIAACYYIIGPLQKKKRCLPSGEMNSAAVVVMKSGRLLLDFLI